MTADERHNGKKLITLDSDDTGMAVQVIELLLDNLKRLLNLVGLADILHKLKLRRIKDEKSGT